MAARPSPPRVRIMGVNVSAITMADALRAVEDWIDRRARHFVCITGVHGVIESQSDPALMAIHERAGLVTPDGMPLVWMARKLGHRHTERVYGPDLMLALSALSAQKGYRQYYYGGAPGLADRLRDRLAGRFPGLAVAGTFSPPFRAATEDEDEATVRMINQARPDIVWIGLSTPKQEYWMADHLGRIDAPVMIGVGAAFDFLAGTKRQAPLWMQRNGLEWLFRLLSEPRRLWRRYGRIVPQFMIGAGLQLLRRKNASPNIQKL
ncbi:WecB/TagA/CpsF family glycosyltransferase [Bosea sp. (in: a-proteobacteria)]|uniref:WecB/TagA/CpsF family glycosyltransferase n=1 Tax=Bosea sp. (in: a-proteobacteria) TaxID=1871050 RepID=UPI00263520F3|nr:WecB/TagA/CpsF family glycosyltransferase [Bosea sp. (in: a-proteobacteria)]MCO5090971.1 WecB/TagA/CpsF family glycosyltransferase [Bosea sp. (in: a-proteobacteria)]